MLANERKDQALDLPRAPALVEDRRICARMIAHELNNLLLPILTFGSLLADSIQEEEAKRDLDVMVASARKARELVKALLVETDRLDRLAALQTTPPAAGGNPDTEEAT